MTTIRLARQRGFALVAVLWFLILLAFLASSFSASSRTAAYLARNLEDDATAEMLADAGVYRVIWGLLQFSEEQALRADGTVYGWAFGDGSVRFSIRGEAGKIDLNAASANLLEELFVIVGVDGGQATTLADAIADFRDVDDDPRPRGAESLAYEAAGLPGPHNGPFRSIEELQQVIGMTGTIYDRIRSSLTVYTGMPQPLPELASADVRAALRASDDGLMAEEAFMLDEFQVDEPLSERSGGEVAARSGEARAAAPRPVGPSAILEGNASDIVEEGGDVGEEGPLTGQSLSIHSEGRIASGAVFVREAVVELGAGDAPYRFFVWRRGDRLYFKRDEAPPDV